MSKCYFHEDGNHIWDLAVDGSMHCACGAEI